MSNRDAAYFTLPDYAEILRLYRKYRARPDEPLWVTFIMIAQQLERAEDRTSTVTKISGPARPLDEWKRHKRLEDHDVLVARGELEARS